MLSVMTKIYSFSLLYHNEGKYTNNLSFLYSVEIVLFAVVFAISNVLIKTIFVRFSFCAWEQIENVTRSQTVGCTLMGVSTLLDEAVILHIGCQFTLLSAAHPFSIPILVKLVNICPFGRCNTISH